MNEIGAAVISVKFAATFTTKYIDDGDDDESISSESWRENVYICL